jgi:hypothetical protein
MLQFNIQGKLPKSYLREKVYGLASRDTYYGLFRSMTSKSTLVFFGMRRDAERYMSWLDGQAARGIVLNRIIDFDQTVAAVRHNRGERVHSKVVSLPILELQKECAMKYLDLWVVYNLPRHLKADDRNPLILNCYEYSTAEPPSRDITNLLLEDLLLR